MSVGKNITRVDAYDKVTGRARYTDDFSHGNMLVAKLLHSTIANGLVKRMDTSAAQALEGVHKVITCFDVPNYPFPTAGHPWSTDVSHQDVANRLLLNRRVRLVGDDIAVVIADNEVIAKRALALIKVEYEEYPPVTTVEAAMAPGASCLHDDFPNNILAHTCCQHGDFEAAIREDGLRFFEASFDTPIVQHCHLENAISYAYMEAGRIVVVSSTQIPHICRRVVGQALGIPWGKVRIVKPYIGGGFGNKQEVLYEPLAAYLTTQVGGRCVKLELSREETFICTRTRHSIHFKLKTAVRPDGRIVARRLEAYSNQGAYASHGHAIVSNAVSAFRQLYQEESALHAEAYTVFTNLPSAGAMRGYGVPQVIFACESQMEDIALAMGLDPIAFRLKNSIKLGYSDPDCGITCHSFGLEECIAKGKAYINWDEKRAKYANQTGPLRRGVGMAMFSYKTGVYPISLESAGCRMVLNQDGSIQMQMGATEIGQGADTVFAQMAAETLSIPVEDVHVVSTQDTDITPFDTGAYASRQTYVGGMAVRETAQQLRTKILAAASNLLQQPAESLSLQNAEICGADGKALISLPELALEALYNMEFGRHLTAEASINCHNNTYSFGVCFVEVEVDIPLGRVRIVDIVNVHDSGKLINPQLAEAQVHGGMSMGLGFALSEQMLFDEAGNPRNNNLLDYKLPTSMDTPELNALFVETNDPTGPYGNKSLGEPPAIPQGAALRNAVLNATGVGFTQIPLTPQRVFEGFCKAGLIEEKGR